MSFILPYYLIDIRIALSHCHVYGENKEKPCLDLFCIDNISEHSLFGLLHCCLLWQYQNATIYDRKEKKLKEWDQCFHCTPLSIPTPLASMSRFLTFFSLFQITKIVILERCFLLGVSSTCFQIYTLYICHYDMHFPEKFIKLRKPGELLKKTLKNVLNKANNLQSDCHTDFTYSGC